MLLYVAATVVLPFSNQITGPIPVPAATSGSGSGSGYENYTDYCGNDISAELSVNVDSVKRIPVYVWVLVVSLRKYLDYLTACRYNISCTTLDKHRRAFIEKNTPAIFHN